eukprot:2025188-Pyramimonas_sp.AAC.1
MQPSASRLQGHTGVQPTGGHDRFRERDRRPGPRRLLGPAGAQRGRGRGDLQASPRDRAEARPRGN